MEGSLSISKDLCRPSLSTDRTPGSGPTGLKKTSSVPSETTARTRPGTSEETGLNVHEPTGPRKEGEKLLGHMINIEKEISRYSTPEVRSLISECFLNLV